MALHIFVIVRSITEISLDLDQLNHVYQSLTIDYEEYFKLTFILTVVVAWSTYRL